MNDVDIARMFSSQTAITVTLIEALIEAGLIDRQDFVNRLYDLLQQMPADGEPSRRPAPILHMISLLEAPLLHSA